MQTQTDDIINILRKKLIFRSWHRGTREMDLMMGKFADAMLAGYSAEQLASYEELMNENDPDLYNWITLHEPVAEHCQHNQALNDIITFYNPK